MKTERGGFRPMRHEQLLQELVHDSYKAGHKLAELTRCPDCGAIFSNGRWKRGALPEKAQSPKAGTHEERCPACHRIHDNFPAGYVTLKGPFFTEHRVEVLARVRHCEQAEKSRHVLERIMAIEANSEGSLVTTTDTHLARRIGEALHNAFKGELDYQYNKEENLLRVTWTR